MPQKNYPAPNQALNKVKEQFKKWRRTRKSPRPMPEELWKAAISLSASHSISQISKELMLDYSALKRRALVKKKNNVTRINCPDFIELGLEPPNAPSECLVEMEDSLGKKMRMHFKNKTDVELLELVNAFFRKSS